MGSDTTADEDTTTDERSYGRGARIIAVFLLVIASGAAIAAIVEGGTTGIAEGVALVYIAIVLTYGVFSETLDTPPVQTAFGAGLTAYGALLYLQSGSLLWLGITAVGVILTVYNGREAVSSR